MKQVLLDTDTLSFFFKGHPNVMRRVDEYLRQTEKLSLSVITFYEALYGLYYKDSRRLIARVEELTQLHQVLPLTTDIARRAAGIAAELRRTGQPIGSNDVLIAATALTHDLTLVTNNTAHFERIPGLALVNWAL